MATIRELQASFVAKANGMKSTIQGVKKDIQGLATETKKVTKGMSGNFNSSSSTIKKSVGGLSKTFRDMSTSASKSFEGIGKSMQTTGKTLENWGTDIQNVGKSASKALSPLTAFYATAALTGGKRMMANEQLDILMRNTFRTEESYASAWESVNGLTKGTAFMNKDVGNWLSQLVQSNVELEKSEDIMKSVLDFSVGSGQLGIEGEIQEIIMKAIRSDGWDQMTLDMMAQRGFNLAGHIANVLGVETSAAQDMLKDGTISMEESLDYFVDAVQVGSEGAGGYFAKMAGSAQKGGETMLGAWINTKAAIAKMGEDMWKAGAWEVLKEALNSFYEFIYQLAPALEPIAKIIASIMATMVDWIQKLMTAFINLRPKTQALIASLSVIGAVLGPAIFMFGTFVGAVGLAMKPLGALFLGLSKVFGVIGKKGLGGAIKALIGRLAPLSRAFTVLTGPIGITIGLFTLLITTSKTFRDALLKMISSIIDFGKKIFKQMKPAIDSVVDSFKIMLKSFKGAGNGFDSIGAAIAPLLSIIGALVKVIMSSLAVALGAIMPAISGIARAIGPLTKAIGSLISVFMNLGKAILSIFTLDFSKSMSYFKAAFQSTIDFFVNLWGAFVGFFTGYTETLMAGMSGLFDRWGVFGEVSKKVWNGIASVFSKAKDAFLDFVSSLSIEPIKKFFVSMGAWFKDGFGSITDSVKSAGRRISQSLTGGISSGLESTSSMFGGIGKRISDAISTSISDSLHYFSTIGERISDSIAGGLVHKAGDLVKGYIDSLKESFKSVSGVATLAAPSLVGMGARMLGLTGPIGLIISIVMSLVNVFKDLYQSNEGFRNGIKDTWEGIQDIFLAVWTVIQPILDEFGKAFGEIAEELGPEFAKTKEIITDSINELKPVFTELGETFSELGTTFADLFKEIGAVVGEVIEDIVPLWIGFQLTFIATISEIVKVSIPALLAVFKSVFPMILGIVKSVITVAVEVFTILIGVVMEVVKAVLPLLLSIVKSVFPLILGLISAVLPMIVSLFMSLIKVAMELIKAVLPLILSVIKAVFPMVLNIVKLVIPVIITIITMLVDVIMTLVKAVLPMILSVVKSVFPMVLGIIKAVLPIVITLITAVVNIILQLAKVVIPLVLKIVQMAFPIIQKIIEVAMKVVVGVLKLLVGVIKNVVVPAIEFFLKIVQVVFPVITKVIEGALKIIIGVLDFFIALFTGNWSGMWEAIKKILSAAISIVWSVIKGAFDLIALFITTIFTGISKFFSFIWKQISDLFSSVIKWIVDFVKARFTALKDNVTTIFNAVKDFASKVWNTIKDNIVNPITSAVKTAIDKFLEFKKSVTDTFKNIKDDVFGYVSDMVQKVKDMPGNMKKGIEAMAYKVFEGMKSLANKMVAGLGKGVNGVVTGVNWVLGKLGVTKPNQLLEWTIPKYAQGTKAHPGGLAIVGDGRGNNAGPELMQTPDGQMSLSPDRDTVMDLPKGTSVLSAKKTREYLQSIPAYANGVGWIKEAAKKTKTVGASTGRVAKKQVVKSTAKVAKKAFDIWEYIKDPSGLLNTALSSLGISSPDGIGVMGDVARGGFNKVKTSAIDFVKEKLQGFDDGSGGNGPVSFGNLRKTSSFGMRFHPIFKQWRLHAGDDYGGKVGTAIRATTGGKVTSSGPSGTGFGTMVKVKNGIYDYIYAHLSRAIAKIGSSVSKGDVIGALGNTGNSTGPHLHYEVRKGGRPVKPGAYKNGGIVNTKQLAWIADGGWAESIISHDPAKKVRQQKIWQQTGDALGFTSDAPDKEMLNTLIRIAKAVERDFSINMDSQKVGELTEPHVTNKQQRRQSRTRRYPK